MTKPRISVRGIGKQFRLGQRQRYRALRDSLAEFVHRPFRRLLGRGRAGVEGALPPSLFWALRDISFDVAEGDAVGLIGRNGSGKSTLLKILSRITEPTTGRAEIRGRVGALLEVGTGFHSELTGRENILLSGAILGMKHREVLAKFDAIVEFAEIERFLDTPVKHFSSGMYMRLAFGVAAHLDPEVLLVDEVLAVGDANFQRKCLGKMGEVARQGRTVIFVSHNLAAVAQLCRTGLLLQEGRVGAYGPVAEVLDAYQRSLISEGELVATFPVQEDRPATITRLFVCDSQGEPTICCRSCDDIVLCIEVTVRQPLVQDHLFVVLERGDGLLVLKASDDDGRACPESRQPGVYRLQARFPGGLLNEGHYRFRVTLGKRRGIFHDSKAGNYFWVEDVTDYRDSCCGKRNGALLLPLQWTEDRITDSGG